MADEVLRDLTGTRVEIIQTGETKPPVRGTFGIVYFLKSSVGNVAVKVLNKDPFRKDRELQTIKLLGHHPNIVKTLAILETSVIIEIVMEAIDCDLCQYMKKHNPLSERRILEIGRQMTIGLNYIHSKGVIHRDFKPNNVLISGSIVKICDFGSSKTIGPGEISTSYICSRFYRAPELILGAKTYGVGIDFWSLGCIFFELVAEHVLFEGRNAIEMYSLIIKTLGTPTEEECFSMKVIPIMIGSVGEREGITFKLGRIFNQKFVELIIRTINYNVDGRNVSESDFV